MSLIFVHFLSLTCQVSKGTVTLQNFPSTFEFDVDFSCFDNDFLVSSSRILKTIAIEFNPPLPSTSLFVYIMESTHFKSSLLEVTAEAVCLRFDDDNHGVKKNACDNQSTE